MLNIAYGDAAMNRTACFQGVMDFLIVVNFVLKMLSVLGILSGPLAAHTLTNRCLSIRVLVEACEKAIQ